MVEWRGGKEWWDRIDELRETVERVQADVRRFDERFNQVDAALLEQRQYTEFAFERLDAKFEQLDTKVDQLETRVDRLDAKVDRLDTKVDRLDGNVSRIERKLDQFIDTQTKANELVERRLQRLESETQ